MATKFYKCSHCGNVVEKVVDNKVPVFCCGQKMEELVPNTVEASGEKHIENRSRKRTSPHAGRTSHCFRLCGNGERWHSCELEG